MSDSKPPKPPDPHKPTGKVFTLMGRWNIGKAIHVEQVISIDGKRYVFPAGSEE